MEENNGIISCVTYQFRATLLKTSAMGGGGCVCVFMCGCACQLCYSHVLQDGIHVSKVHVAT